LKKEFKYVPPPAAVDEKPDEDGVTESMLDFSWERDVEPKVTRFISLITSCTLGRGERMTTTCRQKVAVYSTSLKLQRMCLM